MMSSKNKPLIGIPPSVKIVDLAARYGFTPKTNEQKRAVRDRLKLEEVSVSLNVPAPNSGSALKHDTEIDDSWASLPVMAIHFYERNPRKANNEAYAELKESIRVNGILQPLTVTKRPGESHYILYAGGNTRLQAIRELWEETVDGKFRDTRVIIKAWRGEASVLLAHMAENTQRNDMTFWDRANGTLEIKRQMEEERGKPLSHREFEAELKKAGIQLNLQSISAFRFAIQRLSDIGPRLSLTAIRTIQPRINFLLKLANHHDIEEDVFYSDVISPTAKSLAMRIQDDELTFGSDLFLAECDGALALRLEMAARDLAKMLTAMERFPDMTLDDLRKVCKPTPAHAGHNTQGAAHPTPSPSAPVTRRVAETPASTASTKAPSPLPAHQTSPETHQDGRQHDSHATPDLGEGGSLKSLIQAVLVAAGLASCYEDASNMPHGYYMGFPNDGPLDLKENAQSRQAAWWVLAMASGQFDQDMCRSGLEEGNEWRLLILEEGGQETLGGLELAIQHNIGGQGEFLPIPWLMNPDNAIAGACLNLLSVIRGGAAS